MEAVASPAGGSNPELARMIATKHPIGIHPSFLLPRVHNNKSVQLPYGFHYHHLWQYDSVAYMYIGCVNTVVITISHLLGIQLLGLRKK